MFNGGDGILEAEQAEKKKANADNFLRFYRTKMCHHKLTTGKCVRGSRCCFAHSEEELRPQPNLEKTRMCPKISNSIDGTGRCDDKDCRFAHYRSELRHTDFFYKTKTCYLWRKGECLQGSACRHAHGFEDLRQFRHPSSKREDASLFAPPVLDLDYSSSVEMFNDHFRQGSMGHEGTPEMETKMGISRVPHEEPYRSIQSSQTLQWCDSNFESPQTARPVSSSSDDLGRPDGVYATNASMMDRPERTPAAVRPPQWKASSQTSPLKPLLGLQAEPTAPRSAELSKGTAPGSVQVADMMGPHPPPDGPVWEQNVPNRMHHQVVPPGQPFLFPSRNRLVFSPRTASLLVPVLAPQQGEADSFALPPPDDVGPAHHHPVDAVQKNSNGSGTDAASLKKLQSQIEEAHRVLLELATGILEALASGMKEESIYDALLSLCMTFGPFLSAVSHNEPNMIPLVPRHFAPSPFRVPPMVGPQTDDHFSSFATSDILTGGVLSPLFHAQRTSNHTEQPPTNPRHPADAANTHKTFLPNLKANTDEKDAENAREQAEAKNNSVPETTTSATSTNVDSTSKSLMSPLAAAASAVLNNPWRSGSQRGIMSPLSTVTHIGGQLQHTFSLPPLGLPPAATVGSPMSPIVTAVGVDDSPARPMKLLGKAIFDSIQGDHEKAEAGSSCSAAAHQDSVPASVVSTAAGSTTLSSPLIHQGLSSPSMQPQSYIMVPAVTAVSPTAMKQISTPTSMNPFRYHVPGKGWMSPQIGPAGSEPPDVIDSGGQTQRKNGDDASEETDVYFE